MIVLGAAVHGTELSNTLAGRLVVAVDYHRRNPDAVIVVSGGQGPQEDIPEAVGDAAVPARPRRSRRPDRCRGPIDLDRGELRLRRGTARRPPGPGLPVVFVTDEFHVYRAGRIAAAAGLDATHVSSRTPWYFWPANYLRETVAVVASWLPD